MKIFTYKNNQLYCEGVSLSTIVKKVGTPCYIYSYQHLVDQYQSIREAFAAIDPLICFAMKANDNLSVVKALVKQGAGCDIVSGGELAKAIKVGADPHKIVFASVGKTDDEIHHALHADILFFNVESLPELENINVIAKMMKKTARVALRINPDVNAVTHDRITTGTLKKKFGIDLATAHQIMKRQEDFPFVAFVGVHMHIGSQIIDVAPFVSALKKMVAFVEELRYDGINLEYLDIGGGLGIVYNKEKAATPRQLSKAIMPLLKKSGLKIVMEPGRFICGNAGVLVTKTLYVKDNGVKKFVIVDAGMNDLARPSLYDAYHEIIPVKKVEVGKQKVDVVGPICESGDFFAKDRLLSKVQRGDLLAILSAGAYGYVMSSNYNVRGRGAEVLVKGSRWAVVKERETFQDLIRGELIPKFL